MMTDCRDVERLMDDAKQRALRSGQVGATHWQAGEYDVQIIWIVSRRVSMQMGESISPEQILGYIEDALKDYNFIPRLQNNPLTQLIDLSHYRRTNDPPHLGKGWALRHALDEAIDAIEGLSEDTDSRAGSMRVERYLSHRYRQRLKHHQIARETGWSERNLERLRRELLEKVAGILFAPC